MPKKSINKMICKKSTKSRVCVLSRSWIANFECTRPGGW